MNHLHRIGLGIVLLCAFGCLSDAAKPYGASGKNLKTWLSSMRSKRQNMESDKIWSIRDAIPGEPELDYPIYSEIPDTDFSCDGRVEGYYADVGARCQVFRICANTANDTAKGFAFLCPNGTLFNQEFFVCDWYMNVKCDNSENFYNLNDQIGKTMNTYSKQELMGTARDMIMYPKQTNNYNGDLLNSYPNQMKQQVGLPPSRGSSNLGPTTPNRFSPNENGNEVQRGPGEPVYVNSLGQLSTDRDSGFDPKKSFILKPDRDSQFGLDIPSVPSQALDTMKGIGNSYQFGFNDQTEAPTRGSEDLSEPVEPSAHTDQYLPPFGDRHNPKQIYTYPLEAQQQNGNNIQGILPEYTGSLNSQLPSQNPKYQTTQQVYGQPQQVYGQPQQQQQQQHHQQQHHQQQHQPQQQQQQAQQLYQQPKPQTQQLYQQPKQQAQQQYQQPKPQFVQQQQQYQQPKPVYAQPQQPKPQYQQPKPLYAQPQQPKQGYPQPSQAKPPVQLYQQPKAQQAQKPQYQNQQSGNRQPQPFQQQQPSSFERRQFNVQPQGHVNGNTNQQQQHHHQQSNNNGRQQTPNQHNQHNQHNNQNSNDNARLGNRIGSQSNNQNNGNKQSNGEYVRSLLGGVQEIHHDKVKLVELIQRLFVPATTNTRVVSADVQPSQAQESYSFTFDGSGSAGAASNTRNAYQSPAHTHNQNCGHSQRW